MARHPEIQRKAQAEIDACLGESGTRFPTFADRSQMPLEGLIREVFAVDASQYVTIAYNVFICTNVRSSDSWFVTICLEDWMRLDVKLRYPASLGRRR